MTFCISTFADTLEREMETLWGHIEEAAPYFGQHPFSYAPHRLARSPLSLKTNAKGRAWVHSHKNTQRSAHSTLILATHKPLLLDAYNRVRNLIQTIPSLDNPAFALSLDNLTADEHGNLDPDFHITISARVIRFRCWADMYTHFVDVAEKIAHLPSSIDCPSWRVGATVLPAPSAGQAALVQHVLFHPGIPFGQKKIPPVSLVIDAPAVKAEIQTLLAAQA